MLMAKINPVNPEIQIQTGSGEEFLSHKNRWRAKMLEVYDRTIIKRNKNHV